MVIFEKATMSVVESDTKLAKWYEESSIKIINSLIDNYLTKVVNHHLFISYFILLRNSARLNIVIQSEVAQLIHPASCQ